MSDEQLKEVAKALADAVRDLRTMYGAPHPPSYYTGTGREQLWEDHMRRWNASTEALRAYEEQL